MSFLRALLRRPWLAALLCLVVILVFHSPRWWLLIHKSPGTFEWDRALQYLSQCSSPFRTDVEPAMRWRFLPQLFIWALGGNPVLALCVPWLGVWSLLAYLNHLLQARGHDETKAACMTIILGVSAPILISTCWLGMNDAWVALGLCYLAFGRKQSLLILACLCCPFIDERFVFGIPGALALRNLEALQAGTAAGFARLVFQCACAAMPFLVGRIAGVLLGRGLGGDASFLKDSIQVSISYLWVAPLGFWMALRLAAFPAGWRLCVLGSKAPVTVLLLLVLSVFPVFVGFLLASDTIRTAGILLPLCVWGMLEPLDKMELKHWIWLTAASLLVPAAVVSYMKIMPINSLPVELMRILR